MYDLSLLREVTIKFDKGEIRVPLYEVMASIAEMFSRHEIVSYNTPFGEITLKTA